MIGFLTSAAIMSSMATPSTPPRPIVYIQAGHQSPGEPGYLVQTGAPGEQAFTKRVSAAVEKKLRANGVDARHTPARVTPLAAPAAAFVSIHYDTRQGRAAVGHAITGAGENYYHGQGTGVGRSRPYPDSAPHRRATTVSPAVERRSRLLAQRMRASYTKVFTRANGARSGPVRLESRTGNGRMMRFYGFYRTRAEARVLIETGASGTDARMLRRTDLIATAISHAVIVHLRAEKKLRAR